MIPQSEYILSNSFKGMADIHWEPTYEGVPDTGVIHLDILDAPEFFRRYTDNGRNYVLISSSNDVGLALQANDPVWRDYNKGIDMIPPVEFMRAGDYVDFPMVARCDREKCNFGDRYSLRCYSYTFATIPYVPNNVRHWFMTNPLCDDSRISAIPLGIFGAPDGSVARQIAEFPKQPHAQHLLYINYQNYTRERVELKIYFKGAGFNVRWEPDLSFEQHLAEMDNHFFTLAPEGNGNDTHRLWECLYMGKIPVVQDSVLIKQLAGLPMVVVPDLRMVHSEMLHRKHAEITDYGRTKYSLEKATLSYWRNRIDASRQLL